MKSTIQLIGLILSAVGLFAVSSWAGPLSIPNDFNAGEPAVADQVNANFSAVKGAVDDNDSRITTNADNITTNATDITTNATDITTNATDITTNATNITTNTTNITTNADDINGKQNLVTGSCPAGESIRTINDDGSVVCTQSGLINTVAYAIVSTQDEIHSSSSNINSGNVWNDSLKRYEIPITDVEYNPLNYITLVTPIHNEPRMATVTGSDGDLIIHMFDADGNAVQSSFQFVTFEP